MTDTWLIFCDDGGEARYLGMAFSTDEAAERIAREQRLGMTIWAEPYAGHVRPEALAALKREVAAQ